MMDSLAQELIDETITHVPRWDMFATSLVARRWRRPSQQRNFEFVLFVSDDVTRWEVNIPQDPDGIPSYVHHVRLKRTPLSLKPGILPRVLKTFTLMISLDIDSSHLPPLDELAVPVSLGEFGRGITRLTLVQVQGPRTVITSFIFLFPNLKELVIVDVDFWHDESPPVIPKIPQRRPLESFMVLGYRGFPYNAVSEWWLASRRLSLGPSAKGINLLIGGSSKTMVELTLMGMQLLRDCEKQHLC